MRKVRRESGVEGGSRQSQGGADGLDAERHVAAIADDSVEGRDEIGQDGICIVQAGEDGENVGAWVGVFLAEGSSQEDGQCLAGKHVKFRGSGGVVAYVESVLIRGSSRTSHPLEGATEQLLGVLLGVQKVIRTQWLEDALETGGIRAQEEELLPEAVGKAVVGVGIIVLRRCEYSQVQSSRKHKEAGVIERTLNSVSYRRTILGWKASGRERSEERRVGKECPV